MLRGLLAFALIATTQAGQLPARDSSASQTGTSLIRGRVVAAATGEPLRKARVSLSSTRDPVFTDNEGRFAFANLAAGRYTLTARKTGYALTTFGAARPGSPPISIEVAGGATVDGIEVRMPRGAAISGRITDQYGDPIEMAFVSARRVVRTGGHVDTVAQAATTTDDLGEYRLGGLPEGSFIVSATQANFRSSVFVSMSDVTAGTMVSGALTSGMIGGVVLDRVNSISSQPTDPTYYPGVPGLRSAQAIPLRGGDDVSSIDVTVSPIRLARVSLAIVDANGKPADAAATFAMVGSNPDDLRSGLLHTPAAVAPLEPGEWVAQARGDHGGTGTARFWVGSDDMSVALKLGPGGSIAGSVVVEGSPLPADASLRIEAAPVDPSMIVASARVNRDGTFEIRDLLGVRELRARGAPVGWPLKAILLESRSLIDTPLEFKDGRALTGVLVVLTSRVATLKGTVTDAGGAPARDSSVLVFPEDAALRQPARALARWVRPTQAGEFVVDDLLPGAYLAVAVGDVDESRWPDAQYLAQFVARATRVTLGESEKKMIALLTGDVP